MILLRYGIRCSLHYSVPLTLGLIAYTGSWQGVARNLMSETKAGTKPAPAAPNATEVAASDDATDKSAETSAGQDRPEGDSLAMNPDREDSPRGLTIPRADDRRTRDSIPESASNGNTGSGRGSDRPRRDRDIDATGHQAPIAQSEPVRSGAPLSSGMAAGAAGLAFVAVNSQNVVSEQVASAVTKPAKAAEKSSSTVTPQTALAAEVSKTETSPGTKPNAADASHLAEAAKPTENPATQPEAEVAEAPSAEPAHLNPQIRAIAAEVPSATVFAQNVQTEAAKPAEIPEVQTASQTNEPVREPAEIQQGTPASAKNEKPPAALVATASKPEESQPPETPKAVAKADPKPESSQPSSIDRKKVEIPDVVIAQEGETWNRIASRIYGDEKMAETIWRENRDAHGGSSDTMPIAGRMVRLPESGKRYSIPNSGQTQLARTAR